MKDTVGMNMTNETTRRTFLIASAAVGGLVVGGKALMAQQTQPASDTILTVVPAPGADPVHYSDADLAAMTTISFSTSTIWTEGIQEFSGPSLATVLQAAGLPDGAGSVRLVALNDYAIDLDIAQIEAAAPIVANRIDGAPFGVRDKGPLWVVFPYDSAPRYRAESVYAVSVWQLRHIEAF